MIIPQILSILFALVFAAQNAPTVNKFEVLGASAREMAVFHRYGWWTKLFFCLAAGSAGWPQFDKISLITGLSGLWVYLLFDIALNRLRSPKRAWDYLGLNDADGRFWNGVFGQLGGKIKACVLFAAIVIINLLSHA